MLPPYAPLAGTELPVATKAYVAGVAAGGAVSLVVGFLAMPGAARPSRLLAIGAGVLASFVASVVAVRVLQPKAGT